MKRVFVLIFIVSSCFGVVAFLKKESGVVVKEHLVANPESDINARKFSSGEWASERKQIHEVGIDEEEGNELLNNLTERNAEWLPDDLVLISLNKNHSMKWRNYCIQHFSNLYINKPSSEMFQKFSKVLNCDDRGIKEIAIFTLARISKSCPEDIQLRLSAINLFGENLSGLKHSRLRISAMRGIAHLGIRKFDSDLMEIANNSDETTAERVCAIDTLGAITCSNSEELLLGLLQSQQMPIQEASRNALKRLFPLVSVVPLQSQNVQTLTDALTHDRAQVRLEAASALRKYGSGAIGCIPNIEKNIAQLNEFSSEQDIVIYLELIRSFRKDGISLAPSLAKLLEEGAAIYKSKNKETVHRLRAYLIITIADIGGVRLIMPSLIDAIANSDRDMQIVFAAGAYAIQHLSSESVAFSSLLQRALRPEFEDRPISLNEYRGTLTTSNKTSARLEAIRAIASIGGGADIEQLLENLTQISPSSDSGLPEWKFDARIALAKIRSR